MPLTPGHINPSEPADAGGQIDRPSFSIQWLSTPIAIITGRVQRLITYCIAYLAFPFLLDNVETSIPAASAAPIPAHALPGVDSAATHGNTGIAAVDNPWPDIILILVLLALCFRWTHNRTEADGAVREALQRLDPPECSICRSCGYSTCIGHLRGGHKDPTIVRHAYCRTACRARRYNGCCTSVFGSWNDYAPFLNSLLQAQGVYPVSLADYSSAQEDLLSGSSEESTNTSDKDSFKSVPGSDQGEIDSDDVLLAKDKLARVRKEGRELLGPETWDEVDDQGAEFEQSLHCTMGRNKSFKQSGKARKALKVARQPKAQSKRQKRFRDGVFLGRN